jgi:hypothetical protein
VAVDNRQESKIFHLAYCMLPPAYYWENILETLKGLRIFAPKFNAQS